MASRQETTETVTDLNKFSWAPKSLQTVISAMKLKDSCSLEENYNQPRQHIKNQRHYFAKIKVHIVKAMVFPVVMYGCECWTIKKAERQRTDAFELWCWRRLLRVPRTAKRSNHDWFPKGNQPWIFIGRTHAEAEALATWCKELTHWKRLWCCRILKEGREGDDRGWHGWMASLTQRTWVWASPARWWRTGKPDVLHAVHGVTESQTWMNNWTTTAKQLKFYQNQTSLKKVNIYYNIL